MEPAVSRVFLIRGILPTADIGSSNSASVAASSKMLAATVVSAFTDKLKAEARKNGGFLSENYVDQLSQEFEAKQG